LSFASSAARSATTGFFSFAASRCAASPSNSPIAASAASLGRQ
jgi:hypothetical protein